ncbi:hypothetical protein NDA01_03645 [Trichocoleus desertorum AS-A10]|uniref:hypothetical protein n=1 Tax=Trichocoleus desertorum TaxID=1481672 RepID=UPI003299EB4E
MPYTAKQRLQGMREAAKKMLPAKEQNLSVLPLYDGKIISTGLTKREYFAAMAMQGLLAAQGNQAKPSDAVAYADALLDELNKVE